MRVSDESLLKSFALGRDEDAFRALADRYLGLIFHTALRRTGNRQLAEEVSQNILCAVAKKAGSLAAKPALFPAWLHRATLFESTKAMRSESSHQRRKQIQHPDPISDSSSFWSDAVPHLDLALDQLSESDRSLLLLHYFENRPFPQIAQALGKNPSAVKKQSQRALEKLSRILRSKGVALSATAVATGLTSELAKAAPLPLLQSATTAVLTGSATYSTTGLTLMTAAKSKALVPAVVLLCIAPLTLQQLAISRAEERLENQRAAAAPAITQNRNPVRSGSSRSRISKSTDVLVLVDECEAARQTFETAWQIATTPFQQKLAAMDAPTLENLIRECASLGIHRGKKANLLAELIYAAAEKDPARAVRFTIDTLKNDPDLKLLIERTDLKRPFSRWAQADPASALAWYQEMESSAPRAAFRPVLLSALVLNRSPELRPFLLASPEGERPGTLISGIEVASVFGSRRNHVNTGTELMKILPGYISLIRVLTLDEVQQLVLKTLSDKIPVSWEAGKQVAEVATFFKNAEMTSEEASTIALHVGTRLMGGSEQPGQAQLLEPARRAFEAWVEAEFGDRAPAVLDQFGENTLRFETDRAEQEIRWLKSQKQASDEVIARGLTTSSMRTHLPEALAMAETIRNSELRAKVIQQLNEQR